VPLVSVVVGLPGIRMGTVPSMQVLA
jgi:hypothetical protein